MKQVSLLLLILSLVAVVRLTSVRNVETCEIRHLSKPLIPPINYSTAINSILSLRNSTNFSVAVSEVFSKNIDIRGVILKSSFSALALNVRGEVKIYTNRTKETEGFWETYDLAAKEWTVPFKDCHVFRRTWFYAYVTKTAADDGFGFFVPIKLDQCNPQLEEIFGRKHQCNPETTTVSTFPTPS